MSKGETQEIHPPISERSTEQLMDIIETREEWRSEVVQLAQAELEKRGVSVASLETRRVNRKKFEEKTKAIMANASFTPTEKFLIVLLGPVSALVFRRLRPFIPGEGYARKNKQGIFYLLLGFLLWALVLYAVYG